MNRLKEDFENYLKSDTERLATLLDFLKTEKELI